MMRLRDLIFGAVFLATLNCISVSAQSRFTVGTASAAPGEKANGTLEVPAGVDAATSIPVVVVNGAKPGKVLALVSGAHGTEYVSIIAIEKLIAALDPAQVTGTVILVPLINIQSFEQKVPHVNPVDNKSMNRFYPGKPDGTQTERASFLISKEMVLAFGLDHIIIWRERPTDRVSTRYLDNTASVHGKPSIVVEAGHAGTVDSDDVALLVNGTLSTMRALKMLPGDPHPIENPVWIENLVDVLADGPGIWYPLVKRGSYVSAGMKLGIITDYVGKVIAAPRAPVSAVVLHVNAVPSLKKGDNIADLGVVATHAP